MSRVYLATDERLSVKVAIKENLQTEPQARAQFHREAEFLARLSHPNLPRVTDYFDDAATGRQYLVMDYVEGDDLAAIVQRQGPLPEKLAVTYIAQILDALEYMHEQQAPIIHRDIKPSNIKITPQGKAVLVDFGIAKVYEASALTMTGARSVTPGFAPPEQYGMRTDTRSDIYAVGATLYTLITGQIPPESTLRVANLVTMPALNTLAKGVSPQVENAIRVAMEPDTTKRWNSAKAFHDALLPPPVSAPPLAPTVAVSSLKQPLSKARQAAAADAFPATVRAPVPTQQQPSKLPLILGGLVVVALLIAAGAFLVMQNNGGASSAAPTLVAAVSPTANLPTATAGATSIPATSTIQATVVPTAQATPTAVATETVATAQATTNGAVAASPTVALPTAAPASPQPTPVKAAATATTASAPALSLVSLRFSPTDPHRNQRVQFFVTFRNTFPSTQHRTWTVQIYRADNLKKSFWHSREMNTDFTVGDSEVSTLASDTWCVCGPGGSEDFVVAVQDVGAQQNFNLVSGQPYSFAFTVKP